MTRRRTYRQDTHLEKKRDDIDAAINPACGHTPALRRLAELLKRIEELEWAMARQAGRRSDGYPPSQSGERLSPK